MINDTKYGLYYECHITIEPVFDDLRKKASIIAKKHKFKLAELIMKKSRKSTGERSNKDTFMTSHSINLEDIKNRMLACIHDLENSGFQVWRSKIEDTVIDTKYDRKKQ